MRKVESPKARQIRVFAVAFTLISFGICANAQRLMRDQPSERVAASTVAATVPILSGYVNDYAGVLTPQQSTELKKRLENYEVETAHQIAFLSISTLNGVPIDSFSLKVANAWKLGRKGINNGVLVTLALNDRKTRIEVGSGLNRCVSPATAKRIIEESMVPEFSTGQFGKGIEKGLERLMKVSRPCKLTR